METKRNPLRFSVIALALLGVLFSRTARVAGAQESLLCSFGGVSTDPSEPAAGRNADAHGNLYGTTFQGGTASNGGIVFELSPKANGTWTETILHNFGDPATDGQTCYGSLLAGARWGMNQSAIANLLSQFTLEDDKSVAS